MPMNVLLATNQATGGSGGQLNLILVVSHLALLRGRN